MPQKSRVDVSKIAFGLSCALAVFALGIAAGRFEFFPVPQIRSAKQAIKDVGMLTGFKPTGHIMTSRYDGTGVVRYNQQRTSPGLTLITGFFDRQIEIRLITLDGDVVQRWPVRYSQIWPRGASHVQPRSVRPKTDWNNILNGAVILADGSVVFNLWGVVKMSRSGDILWKLPEMSHHSLERSMDGGLWVPGRKHVNKISQHLPLQPPFDLDTIMKVSATGKKVKEITVLDLFWKNQMLASLFANNRHFALNRERDVVHLNDIEELPEALAVSFSEFDAGDLLLSLREPNMLMVIDPETEIIKWFQVGPWIQQHDGDWQPDGTITVFDNNFDGSDDGSVFGGSNIIAIRPDTRAINYLYGRDVGQRFYTSTMGDHQILENGNVLIVESQAGRVFEVNTDGEVVWEFINRYSDDEVLRICDAVRYPTDYFTVEWTSAADADKHDGNHLGPRVSNR